MFGKDKKGSEQPDNLLGDLLRGEEGRAHGESYQARGYFEKPELIAQHAFHDHAGDNFLGIIGGTTTRIMREDGRPEYKTTGGIPIGSRDDRHRTLVAGSRSGKGRSVLIPEMLTYAGSMIVIDPKGENTAITARFRAETLKQKVCVLDPFGVTPEHCHQYRAQYNPLGLVNMNNPTAFEDLALIADALVVPTGDHEAHWNDTARAFIEGVILFLCSGNFDPAEQHLIRAADLISGKEQGIRSLLEEMEKSYGPSGRVAAAATTLLEMGENERGSVLSTTKRNLKFLDGDAMASTLTGHSFDLADLKNQPTTIYLVLPAMYMNTCRQWLRLFVNLTLAEMEKNPTKPKYPVQMILDEMPVLGYMKELESAIGQMAGLGLRVTSVLQDLGQLKALYKDRFETFFGNSGLMQFFGIVDHFTSDWISRYLGETTIKVTEQNAQSIEAQLQGASGKQQRSQTMRLMNAEEVRRFFARGDRFNRQLALIPGERPWIIQRANYDQHEFFAGRFDEWR